MEKIDKKTRRRLRIGIPYFLLVAMAVYVFFDWYNTVPYDAEQEFSYFEQPDPNWEMVKNIDQAFAGIDDNSHGVILYDGKDAISARLAMINNAQHTIDMQYFLIKPDAAGAIFANALIEAAERGVRVRFLIDDVFTTTSNDQMRFLAAHPGIELRYYNPLSRKVWKYANYVLDPFKINRRMHNKSLTIDGVTAVVGGRNIADEYYGISDAELFADLDIFLAGDIVKNIGFDFDKFWNDEFAVDANLLLGEMSEEEKDEILAGIEQDSIQALKETYAKSVNSNFIQDVAEGEYSVYHFDGYTVVDQPAKLRETMRGKQHFPIMKSLEDLINNAEQEVFMTSPYFVPEDWGSEMFQNKAREGVKVQIVTNSLMATNHAYVHGGYYYRRKELLEAGVKLYEVRSDANEVLDLPNANGDFPHLTMHTKLFIVDRRYVFIGSPNFDPRSMYINTEFGVLIDSPEVAEDLLGVYETNKSKYAYELRLEDKKESWIFNEDQPEEIVGSEPATFGRKFIAFWAHWLPFESQY